MIKLAILITVLILGMIAGPEIAGNKGYVLISWAPYTIETSVTSALIIAILFYLALLIIEWILGKIFGLGRSSRNWFGSRKTKKARKETVAGMLAMAEGDFKNAERLVAKSAKGSETPVLNYLTAAQAAQALGDETRRDDYLRQANEESTSRSIAVDITQAKLQIEQKQLEQALATLTGLQGSYPKHKLVLSLLRQVYEELGEWKKLIDLIPTLTKLNILTEQEAEALQQKAYIKLFKRTASNDGSNGITLLWKKMPRKLKQDSVLVKAVCHALMDTSDHDGAFNLLSEKLRKQYSDELVPLFSQFRVSNYQEVIDVLESFLSRDGNNPILNSICGRIMMQADQVENAKEKLTRSMALGESNPQDCAILAGILENEGQSEEARQLYRQGLELSLQG